MKIPILHIDWTAGKNLALPDNFSGITPHELLTRKTTVEIPQNIKFYLQTMKLHQDYNANMQISQIL